MIARNRLIVALDLESFNKARRLVEETRDLVDFYKVGSALFTRTGPKIIRYLKGQGLKVFLDLKFHDIPSVVSRAAEVCTLLGVDMFNLHTLGGFEMLEQVVMATLRTAERRHIRKPLILGVTVLTSLDEAEFQDIFGKSERSLSEEVKLLARLAQSAGLDGIVASPHEATMIKEACGPDFLVVTPGIRLASEPQGFDQARFLTPREAILKGADYIVVGRPITRARSPRVVIEAILSEIRDAQAD
jgi:orotidine-5'-phosphate decarboxylase